MLKTTSGLLLLTLLILPKSVSASVDVQIYGNENGSDSNVTVKSNTSGSTQNSNNSSNTTDIRIETNGEIKEYHGTGDQNIKVESGNGSNSVSVNNKATSNPSSSPIASSSSQASSAPTSAPTPDSENKAKTFLEMIKKEIQSFLNLFKF